MKPIKRDIASTKPRHQEPSYQIQWKPIKSSVAKAEKHWSRLVDRSWKVQPTSGLALPREEKEFSNQ
jgi:hypothetical protein